MEEFRDYNGYKVSNQGRVINRYRKELKCSINNRGYRYFQTSGGGVRKNHLIHQVIGKLFMGERPKEENGKEYVIDHIDRNKLNNHIDNLRYITFKDNLRNTDKYVDEITEEDPVLRNKLVSKRYRELHKEELNQKKKEYYNNNKDKVKQKVREYYNNNKDKVREYGIKYRTKNREIVLEKNRIYASKIIKCDACNVSFRQDNLSKHNKTKLHKRNT